MYERFSDRARKTMQLANQEAQRFCHEYIGTEHILLGLVKEGSGVAANILRNLDIDLPKIRLEVEKIIKTGTDTVVAGKLPQTPRARMVIQRAIETARALNHNYVGTEHILCGLSKDTDGVAGQVLTVLGITYDKIIEEINLLLVECKSDDRVAGVLDVVKSWHPVGEWQVFTAVTEPKQVREVEQVSVNYERKTVFNSVEGNVVGCTTSVKVELSKGMDFDSWWRKFSSQYCFVPTGYIRRKCSYCSSEDGLKFDWECYDELIVESHEKGINYGTDEPIIK